MNINRGIRVMLLVSWMMIIFAYSAQPADISTQDSHRIGRLVADTVQEFKQVKWSAKEEQTFVEHIDFYVRKAAHVTEYAVLGVLLMGCLQSFGINSPRLGRYALAVGILYAASDELHQYFVPGRACQLRDVAIDGIGVLLGVMVFSGIKKRNHDKKEAEC